MRGGWLWGRTARNVHGAERGGCYLHPLSRRGHRSQRDPSRGARTPSRPRRNLGGCRRAPPPPPPSSGGAFSGHGMERSQCSVGALPTGARRITEGSCGPRWTTLRGMRGGVVERPCAFRMASERTARNLVRDVASCQKTKSREMSPQRSY